MYNNTSVFLHKWCAFNKTRKSPLRVYYKRMGFFLSAKKHTRHHRIHNSHNWIRERETCVRRVTWIYYTFTRILPAYCILCTILCKYTNALGKNTQSLVTLCAEFRKHSSWIICVVFDAKWHEEQCITHCVSLRRFCRETFILHHCCTLRYW